MMECVDKLPLLREQPALDLGCGFGRNTVALALRGISVVCVDRDLDRLRNLATLASEHIPRSEQLELQLGTLYPVCADLKRTKWPFCQNYFSAIVCVHFLNVDLIDQFWCSLVTGGYLYHELPRRGHSGDHALRFMFP
jgi:tellurite methyltransferase